MYKTESLCVMQGNLSPLEEEIRLNEFVIHKLPATTNEGFLLEFRSCLSRRRGFNVLIQQQVLTLFSSSKLQ